MARATGDAADSAAQAIQAGDVATLAEVLADNPELATARPGNRGGRTLLHIATDWPGHFPNVADTVRLLAAAGADVNAPSTGRHAETPLHWAASSDDIDAMDALLDAGADINARGGAVGDGTALCNATAFGQWEAAQRLVDRGAAAGAWEAAVMGLLPRLIELFTEKPPAAPEVTSCFWGACHGGQVATATYLSSYGADINWIGFDDLTPLDAAERENRSDIAEWLRERGGRSAATSP